MSIPKPGLEFASYPEFNKKAVIAAFSMKKEECSDDTCMGKCKNCDCCHLGRSEDGEHLCRCSHQCQCFQPSFNHEDCDKDVTTLPQPA